MENNRCDIKDSNNDRCGEPAWNYIVLHNRELGWYCIDHADYAKDYYTPELKEGSLNER